MKNKLLKVACWSAGTVVALMLLTLAGLWSARICYWNSHVRDFYRVPLDDGPHVFRENGKIRIVEYEFVPPRGAHWSRVFYAARRQEMAGGYRAKEQIIDAADADALVQIGRRHSSLSFDFLSPSKVELSRYSAPRLAALSDIHGSVGPLRALLKAAGVVDEKLNWNWGAGRLVVAGDIADKGPGAVAAFWLLRRLEAQASASGGGVHVLLGNHDVMLLRESGSDSVRFYHGRKYAVMERELSMPYGQLFRRGSVLGDWLRTRNTVVQINDLLFIHGGISRPLLDQHWSLAEINAHAREFLRQSPDQSLDLQARKNGELLTGYWGPYEYKGYFDTKGFREQFDESVITDTLSRYQCRGIVVGHATVSSIQAVRGGKVLAIGVKLPETDILGSAAGELLLIEGDHCARIRADGSRLDL